MGPQINVKLRNDDKYVLTGDKYNPDTDEAGPKVDVHDNKATIYLTPKVIQAAVESSDRSLPHDSPTLTH